MQPSETSSADAGRVAQNAAAPNAAARTTRANASAVSSRRGMGPVLTRYYAPRGPNPRPQGTGANRHAYTCCPLDAVPPTETHRALPPLRAVRVRRHGDGASRAADWARGIFPHGRH